MNTTCDLKQTLKPLYRASSARPALIDVPELNYLQIDGTGRPEEAGFEQAAQALYPLVYTLKYMPGGLPFTIMPMEVSWTLDRTAKTFAWTMFMVIPDAVDDALLAQAAAQVRQKHNPQRLVDVRRVRWAEGRCVTMLHRGPYETMNDTLGKMNAFGAARGLTLRPDTHDIYLNSVLKTRPENLRTIMRAAVLAG